MRCPRPPVELKASWRIHFHETPEIPVLSLFLLLGTAFVNLAICPGDSSLNSTLAKTFSYLSSKRLYFLKGRFSPFLALLELNKIKMSTGELLRKATFWWADAH